MTLAAIDKTNMLSQAWQNVYDIVNNRTYIPDPLSPGGGRKFVYTREPNPKSNTFAGFPFIVLQQPLVSFDRESMNYKRKMTRYTIVMTVYSSDRLAMNQQPGDGVKYLNSISNDVIEAFNSSTVKEILRPYAMDNLNIDCTGNDVIDLDEDVVFTRDFEITFYGKRSVF